MIVLASSSERRINLLKDAGIQFDVVPSEIEETFDDKLNPEENAMRISRLKALDVFSNRSDDIVIAADTIVVYQNKIFGKPKNNEDAFLMLKMLSNKTHDVITGVTIVSKKKTETFYSKSKVSFKDLTDDQINEYIKTGEPFGKAGSYAIQGLGKKLIETYQGDFFTIIGLPLKDVLEKLATF